VAVHPGAAAVAQDRPAHAVADSPVDGPPHPWWQRHQDDLAAFAVHAQHAVPVLLTQVGDVRAGGLKDPHAQRPEHGHQRDAAPVR
jgi:hypothetical protein